MTKIITYQDGMLHILRNPYGFTEDVVRDARVAAADCIEAQLAHIDLMADEFQRIGALVPSGTEIANLCERALTVTRQRVPVIEQRDRLERENAKLRGELADVRGAFDDLVTLSRANGLEVTAFVCGSTPAEGSGNG